MYQTEGWNSPVKVVFVPVATTGGQFHEEQPDADLDDLHACSFFKVKNFILDSKSDLEEESLIEDGNDQL